MRSKQIITNDKEVYEKFNMLNFTNEISFSNGKSLNIGKIVSNINKNGTVLIVEKTKDMIKIKKINPYRINAYFYKKESPLGRE